MPSLVPQPRCLRPGHRGRGAPDRLAFPAAFFPHTQPGKIPARGAAGAQSAHKAGAFGPGFGLAGPFGPAKRRRPPGPGFLPGLVPAQKNRRAKPSGCLETAICKCVFSLVLRSGQGRPALRWVLNYALTFRTATAAATTATMIMAKPITLALSPVLGMDTVGSTMMGWLVAVQVVSSADL